MKRSRGDVEAAHRAEQSPYAFFGTPLPAFDSDARDDGSYVPVWKQEVRDEQGRKRLHGAFTGGFSAGYFNTVGSKEGWSPSTFVSSRSNRSKDAIKAPQQRPEDFMDDEDLADAAEAQKVQTAESFAALGSTEEESAKQRGLLGLFRTQGETMGTKLLKKMGWRDGQGIGPKVRRKARLGGIEGTGDEKFHFFAPENTYMVKFVRKTDHKGLDFEGGTKLEPSSSKNDATKSDDDEDEGFGTVVKTAKPKKKKAARGGIGIGILNDTGSDDEDPFEVGPRIAYNKVLGGDKKKKKPIAIQGPIKPVFISKKAASARAATGFRKCHDGRLPLDGFLLGSDPEISSSIIMSDAKYLPPKIPEGWKSNKQSTSGAVASFVSTTDAAKVSKLDPKSRASLLGESALPGKSVFDFLSPAARDRLAAASGKETLPAALGEVPEGYSINAAERQKELFSQVPKVEKDTAVAALGRGASGWMPYAEDEVKRTRYRTFLEIQAGFRGGLPDRGSGMSTADWIKELHEFVHCAQIFKPMTGMMANRFTSSSTKSSDVPSSSSTDDLVRKPAPKPEDPAEAAAKVGMFGPMTRTSQDFYPTRLLCKRFNVRPPAHVQLDPERADGDGGGVQAAGSGERDLDLVGKGKLDDMMKEHWDGVNSRRAEAGIAPTTLVEIPKEVVVEPDRNEALEGEKAGDAVFRAIFGDSDDDNDD